MKRYQLGTGYPAIVRDVREKFDRDPLAHKATLVLDASGCGGPVVDLFGQEQGSGALKAKELIAVTITGGNSESWEWERGIKYFRVAKRTLVSALQVPLQAGQLQIASMPEAGLLANEMQNFQVKINDNATDIYAAREGQHDDLVLATALACWHATRPNRQFRWA